MMHSIYEFFQLFAAAIFTGLGFPSSLAMPASKITAVIAMLYTAILLLRLTVQLYVGIVEAVIKTSTASSRLKLILRKRKQSDLAEYPKERPPVALGAELGLALNRLTGPELETLQEKSTEEIIQYLDEKFGSSQKTENPKFAKIEFILAKF